MMGLLGFLGNACTGGALSADGKLVIGRSEQFGPVTRYDLWALVR
jgi:hypothetical protein